MSSPQSEEDPLWCSHAESDGAIVKKLLQLIEYRRVHPPSFTKSVGTLPVQGVPVTLRLLLGRWRCRNSNCERKIFAERIPVVAAPHRQRTERMESIVQLVGHSLGGRPAERLMNGLGMAVSDDTILRRLKSTTRVPSEQLRVVGIGPTPR